MKNQKMMQRIQKNMRGSFMTEYGLVLILVAGFGLMKFRDISHSALPVWIILKIVIWLAFGGLLTLAYKNPKAAKILWIVFPLMGLIAAYLAFYQPS